MSEQRHFTRKDVADYVQQMHQPSQGDEMQIKHVELLFGIVVDIPPLWVVTYVMEIDGRTSHEMTDVIIETSLYGSLRLLPLVGRDLPTGYATVAEEDAAMQAEREAEQAKWNPKHNEK